MTKSKTKLLQYNEEDVNALEHVTMLIDEYLCCDDIKLTKSGKELKDLVANFFNQWDEMLRKYACSKVPKSPMDFVKTLEEAHEATKGSTMTFK